MSSTQVWTLLKFTEMCMENRIPGSSAVSYALSWTPKLLISWSDCSESTLLRGWVQPMSLSTPGLPNTCKVHNARAAWWLTCSGGLVIPISRFVSYQKRRQWKGKKRKEKPIKTIQILKWSIQFDQNSLKRSKIKWSKLWLSQSLKDWTDKELIGSHAYRCRLRW